MIQIFQIGMHCFIPKLKSSAQKTELIMTGNCPNCLGAITD